MRPTDTAAAWWRNMSSPRIAPKWHQSRLGGDDQSRQTASRTRMEAPATTRPSACAAHTAATASRTRASAAAARRRAAGGASSGGTREALLKVAEATATVRRLSSAPKSSVAR